MNRSTVLKLALGWVILAVGGFAIFVWPRVSGLMRLGDERAQLQQRVVQADDGAAELTRLSQRLERLRRRAEEQTKEIPPESDVAGLIRQLTARLDQLGMSEREITTGSPIQLAQARSLPMTVSMTGRFLSVHRSIRWIESLPRLVRVKRVTIELPDQRSGSDSFDWRRPEVDAEMVLDVFYAPTGEPNDRRVAGAQENTG